MTAKRHNPVRRLAPPKSTGDVRDASVAEAVHAVPSVSEDHASERDSDETNAENTWAFTPPDEDPSPGSPTDPQNFDHVELVESADFAREPSPSEMQLRAFEDMFQQHDLPTGQIARGESAPMDLTLSRESIARGIAVREAFENAGDDSDVAERLLQEFVGGEVPIVRELGNVEGALVALLGRTVTDPVLALRVAGVLKETVAVSAAVRRRAETSLAAAASLRAQRVFLDAHRLGNRAHRGE